MSTPRSAAAAAKAATASSRNASASISWVGGGDSKRVPNGRKEKIKVDWKDVEAKAKREAMWLLEWRKQQAAEADATQSREPPKKRRRKSNGSANDCTRPHGENVPVDPTVVADTNFSPQIEPNKDAASKRPTPASSRPGTEMTMIVTPPEPWLSSVAPAGKAVATVALPPVGGKKDEGDGAASGAPVYDFSARLKGGDVFVESLPPGQPTSVSRSPGAEVVSSAHAVVGPVGLDVAPGGVPPPPPEPTSSGAISSAQVEPCPAFQAGNSEELSEELDIDMSEPPMENDVTVAAQCLPIPTEDHVFWPRLPMPENEPAWTNTFCATAPFVGQNSWSYWSNSVFDNSGPVLSAYQPGAVFFPTPPPLPPPPSLVTVTFEVPHPSENRSTQGCTSESTATRAASRLEQEKGISLLAAAAADRVCKEDHQQPRSLNGSDALRPSETQEKERDTACPPCRSSPVGECHSVEEQCGPLEGKRPSAYYPMEEQCGPGEGKRPSAYYPKEKQCGPVEGKGPSTAPPAGAVASKDPEEAAAVDVGAPESFLPWRPRELRFIVRGGAKADAAGVREGISKDGASSSALANRKGERTLTSLRPDAHRLPRTSKFLEAATTKAARCEARCDVAVPDRRTNGHHGNYRASHGRGHTAAPRHAPGCHGSPVPGTDHQGLGRCRDFDSPTSLPSSMENGLAVGESRPMPDADCLRYLPADGLKALEAVGLWSETDAAAPDTRACRSGVEPKIPTEGIQTVEQAARVFAATGAPVMWGYDGYYDGEAEKKRKAAVMKRRRRPRRKRETHFVVSESEGEDEPETSTSMWAGVEEKAKAEAKALLSYRSSGLLEMEADDNQHWVRRSVRAAGTSALEYPHVAKLLEQIRSNDPEVEVLKLHHYLGPDVNTAVINAVLEALSINSNCQALYIQNFNDGFQDEQVVALSKVLRRGNIWCLNAGENYKVSLSTWWQFVEDIKSTNVTHAYLSEHVITPELKIAMRTAIRNNRAKHTRHKSASNFDVIRRCTNMWWNPINSKGLQAELKLMDTRFGGMEDDIVAPVAKRVPCSLHEPPIKRPDSPDLTDCPLRPRGPCVFRDGIFN